MRLNAKHILLTKVIIHIAAITPAILTYLQAVNDQLGGDPVKAIIHFTGLGAVKLLLISLTVSPLAKRFKQGQLINLRRLLGLYAYFYASLHLVSYLLFELQLEWEVFIDEIIKRPYITVGMVAFLILTLLTLTSTKNVQRKMKQAWQRLHNWVYFAVFLAVIHFYWSVKSVTLEPIIYIVLALILLGFRREKLMLSLRRRRIKNQQLSKN
jgi:sulfoxide reductase heme-binding subunit YedZ